MNLDKAILQKPLGLVSIALVTQVISCIQIEYLI